MFNLLVLWCCSIHLLACYSFLEITTVHFTRFDWIDMEWPKIRKRNHIHKVQSWNFTKTNNRTFWDRLVVCVYVNVWCCYVLLNFLFIHFPVTVFFGEKSSSSHFKFQFFNQIFCSFCELSRRGGQFLFLFNSKHVRLYRFISVFLALFNFFFQIKFLFIFVPKI